MTTDKKPQDSHAEESVDWQGLEEHERSLKEQERWAFYILMLVALWPLTHELFQAVARVLLKKAGWL